MSTGIKKRRKLEKMETARSKADVASAVEEAGALNTASDPVVWRKELFVILFLVLAVLIPYAQVLAFGFVDYDDNLYVFENQQVMEGLNAKTFVWAFTNDVALYFHPLTWLSHLLDSTIYGMKAGGHHFTSLLIHLIDTVLLFWVLRRMTGLLWASALTAALFGVHPLHVESVAWVAERKDVLSAFFWIAGMGVYARYVRTRSIPAYILMAAVFVLAIMSKPMVVTFPCALLLLDYWPLNRFGALKPGRDWFAHAGWLALEKAPLFALSLASAASTMIMQKAGGNLNHSNIVSLPDRIANAFVAYAVYVGKTILPFHLAPFYPHPGTRPIWQTGLALLFLICISVPVVLAWRKRPYLIVGWLWFVGTLVPVIELVQAGDFAYADRYTYLPSIGLSFMLFFGVADLVRSGRLSNKLFVGAGTAWVVVLMVCTAFQAHLWRDTSALFNHTLEVTSDNYPAHNSLGLVLMKQKKLEEAKTHFLKALEIKPDYLESNTNAGLILMDQGKLQEAETYLSKALKVKPDYVDSLNNMGLVLQKLERYEEAKAQFLKAVELQPDSDKAHLGAGSVLINLGNLDEATSHFHTVLKLWPNEAKAYQGLGIIAARQDKFDEAKANYIKAIELQPDDAKAYQSLGALLARQRKYDEAKTNYLKAIELQPDIYGAYNDLGLILMTQGKLDEAKTHYLKAIELQPGLVEAYNNLGMLFVNQGKPDEAKPYLQKALELKPDSAAAYEGMGAVLLNQGHPDEAKAAFLKAIELKPTSAKARYGLGSLLANQGNLDEAKASFLKAIELQPDLVEAHINLGVVLKHQGLLDEAKARFQKVLEIAPNSAAARKYLDEMR